jgi:hypothetical protein
MAFEATNELVPLAYKEGEARMTLGTKLVLPLLVLGALATFGYADGARLPGGDPTNASADFADTVICTQTDSGATAGDGAHGLQQGGCVASIPTSNPQLFVASDGESPFDPFGFGADTSDGIQLNASWTPDPAFASAFAPGFWTRIPGTFTWVLPAATPGGTENEPTFEPIAKWDFLGAQWAPGTPNRLVMLDPGGTVSDLILVDNTGPNGSAAITFSSDPNVIPEPPLGWLAVLMLAATLYLRRRFA